MEDRVITIGTSSIFDPAPPALSLAGFPNYNIHIE